LVRVVRMVNLIPLKRGYSLVLNNWQYISVELEVDSEEPIEVNPNYVQLCIITHHVSNLTHTVLVTPKKGDANRATRETAPQKRATLKGRLILKFIC